MSSSAVSYKALLRASAIIDEMLVHRPDLEATIAGFQGRVVIMAESEVPTDIPELSDLYERSPGTDWNERIRGGAAFIYYPWPFVTIWEPNLLCSINDSHPDEDILVHEFAHMLLYTVEQQPGGMAFRQRLESAYQSALNTGLWEHTYAAETAHEYWAEGVQSWFGLNNPPNAIHNQINARAEIQEYDPVLVSLIQEVFGETTVTTSCHEVYEAAVEHTIKGRVLGPNDEPLSSIGIWAWGGEDANNGYAQTRADGSFTILTQGGLFTLDIYAGEGCSFVGWWDGEGITPDRVDAVPVSVVADSISGITIRLPAPPDDLPRVGWCA